MLAARFGLLAFVVPFIITHILCKLVVHAKGLPSFKSIPCELLVAVAVFGPVPHHVTRLGFQFFVGRMWPVCAFQVDAYAS